MSTQSERTEGYEMLLEWFNRQKDNGLNTTTKSLRKWEKQRVIEDLYMDFIHKTRREYAQDDYSQIYIDINTVKLSYVDRARIIIEGLYESRLFKFEDYQEMIAKVIDKTIKDDIAVINEVRRNLELVLRDVNDCGEAERLDEYINKLIK